MANDSNFQEKNLDSKVLSQDEIDSLLGYGIENDTPSTQKNGVQAILNSNMVFYERLPMLEIVFDRLIRQMARNWRSIQTVLAASRFMFWIWKQVKKSV